jgi:acyl-CoA reductase-like NAD-dependent aldehyde dehydrogenase
LVRNLSGCIDFHGPQWLIGSLSCLGPIIPVLQWSNEADVISRANNTKSGLGASIWNSDATHAERVGRQIQSGSVFINSWAKTTPRGMLSGHKESGIGGEWGSTGILHYCNVQVMHVFK